MINSVGKEVGKTLAKGLGKILITSTALTVSAITVKLLTPIVNRKAVELYESYYKEAYKAASKKRS